MSISLFCKRDAILATVLGSSVGFALNIWFNHVVTPETIRDHIWLACLQEPGTQTGERLLHFLYPIIGYPWNVRLAVISAYIVIALLWTAVILTVCVLARITARAMDRLRYDRPIQ
jgi:hypothetical protein